MDETISVIGLGYVGSVTAGGFAKLGFRVIGVDVDGDRVRRLNSGKPPVYEPGLEILIREGWSKGLLRATESYDEAISKSQVSLLCVGTPSSEDGDIDLSYIFSAVKKIANVLKRIKHYHLIVVRSTVVPGTIEKIAKVVQEISGKEYKSDFGVVSNPEFLREGSAVKDFFEPMYILVGTESEKDTEIMKNLYKGIESELIFDSPRVVELIKYFNNAFHALKISFSNEVGRICSRIGVDSRRIMELVTKDKKLNISEAYLKPGFAFGGACLPKDLRALTKLAEKLNVEIPVLKNILKSNEEHIQFIIKIVLEENPKTIGVIGLSFKPGTDDLRESPSLKLIKILLEKGISVFAIDKAVNSSRVLEILGRHDRFQLVSDYDKLIESTDVVVMTQNDDRFISLVERLGKEITLIDLIGLKRIPKGNVKYRGAVW